LAARRAALRARIPDRRTKVQPGRTQAVVSMGSIRHNRVSHDPPRIMIPFNKPYMTGKELWYIAQAHANAHLAGDGAFTRKVHAWLEDATGTAKALLTHSCTAALEMAAMLSQVQPGDEVIMPSFTFVSTANAFVLRGAVPVFVDIRDDTLNLDERLVEAAITPRTRAIVPVHYAGVGCEMDAILQIAARHGLLVIEDAAQGVMSRYRGRPLGAIGHLGAYSFHETKNISSGEGGALLVNDARFAERAEVLREKGTNRSKFYRGQVDKYTWIDEGSSYLPSELVAAFLFAQTEEAESITRRRLDLWNQYHTLLLPLEHAGALRRPVVPGHCEHNAHMYYILLESLAVRTRVIEQLKNAGVNAVFHYVPLHDAPFAKGRSRTAGGLPVTERQADRLLRLPLWVGMRDEPARVVDALAAALGAEAGGVHRAANALA
jgi:dTDP-4-amino-4,6-dideoxygalactose transaminase